MSFRDACIPVRLGWSSPFARWQGPLAEVSSLDLAAQVTADALASRGLPASEVTGIVLGWTVPQPEIFYGASTVAARIGGGRLGGDRRGGGGRRGRDVGHRAVSLGGGTGGGRGQF